VIDFQDSNNVHIAAPTGVGTHAGAGYKLTLINFIFGVSQVDSNGLPISGGLPLAWTYTDLGNPAVGPTFPATGAIGVFAVAGGDPVLGYAAQISSPVVNTGPDRMVSVTVSLSGSGHFTPPPPRANVASLGGLIWSPPPATLQVPDGGPGSPSDGVFTATLPGFSSSSIAFVLTAGDNLSAALSFNIAFL